jgi:DNA-binding MarR family transcriptional regulator
VLGFRRFGKKTVALRLKLSPLQRDIMWALQEAGGETIGTVIATVKPLDQIAFDRAVDSLIKLSLIRVESSNGKAELVLTETGLEALRK